jgi:hypothetical protein
MPSSASENPAIPPHELAADTCSVRLSERDAAEVMAAAENPPAPTEAALRAARQFLQGHG